MTESTISPTTRRIVLSGFFFLTGICFASWASRIPDIKMQLGLSDGAFGGLLFFLPIGSFLGIPISGTLTASIYSTTVNDGVTFTTTGNGGTTTKFEWSFDNFSTVAGTVNNPANPYTLILNVQQPTMWFRTTSVSGTCPAGVTTPISVTLA